METAFAATPKPPYYAVIFSSQRSADDDGYDAMAARMLELAAGRDGFLGVESARAASGFGITVSYWRDEAAILAWKRDTEHRMAQLRGRQDWYTHYEVRIARVERAYTRPTSE
ncbi:antibiotic biosynthesis monooxygenase family protein [Solimonas marina]|uniref:Antibiotic biosynthesis monooxygenase n=1 Tax=Solimonas marina TaxID=2714601 RepID=A0A969WCA3_9GAMM|nr:antibiotic biosynthesis monooxygenase [Solimonas marina]NKF23388.1 antibiotic biosynthesis monooxygenase [Solimonas marina]